MRLRLFFAVLVCCLSVCVGSASATFPGLNGRISGVEGYQDASGGDAFRLVWFGLVDGGFERPGFGDNAVSGVWSPDGTKLLFTRLVDPANNKAGLFVFSEVTGLVEPVVTDHPDESIFGVWSPDGTKIAYMHPSSTGGSKTDLSIRDLSTGREYLAAVNVDFSSPSWSVRGQIAFVRGDDVVVLTLPTDLAQPGVEKTITRGDLDATSSFGALTSPDFSPRGDRLVVTQRRAFKSRLYFVDPDGTNPAKVSRNTTSDSKAAWSPDGKKLVFASERGGSSDPQVYTRNAVTLDQVDAGASADEERLPGPIKADFFSWQPVQPGSGRKVIDPVSHRPTTHPRRDRDTNAPKILVAKVTKPVLSHKASHGSVSLRLSEDAKVQVVIKRKGSKKPVFQIVRNARAGVNKITFPTRQTVKRGKQKQRTALKPGRYQIVITAKDPRGNTSKPQTLVFQIKKR